MSNFEKDTNESVQYLRMRIHDLTNKVIELLDRVDKLEKDT